MYARTVFFLDLPGDFPGDRHKVCLEPTPFEHHEFMNVAGRSTYYMGKTVTVQVANVGFSFYEILSYVLK